MNISIVIVSYNSTAFIFSCLQSIKDCLTRTAYEVVVVDNHSADSSRQFIRRQFPDILLMENSENRGFARAVNQGYEKTTGRYILILNPDVRLLPGSVNKAITFLERNPEVGVLLPKLLNPDGSLQFSCRSFFNFPYLLFRRTPLGKIFPNHQVIRKHFMMDWDHANPREVDWGLGGCMFLRRGALRGGKVFDERFFLYMEDVDLCFQMKEKGWKVIYYPEAVMVHAHLRESAKGVFNRAKWEHVKSMIRFYRKYGGFKPRISGKDT
jgi:GT2 family glycosyltransferase